MLRRLVGYAAYMFGANFVTGMFSMIIGTAGMASLPKEAYGDYALYMRIYELGQGLFIFGANASIQRYAAGDEENRVKFSALAFRLFFILMGITTLGGALLGYFAGWRYSLALFGLPWLVFYWWGRYVVRSNLDAKREARMMMIASLSNNIATFCFLTFTDYRDSMIYGDFVGLVCSGIGAMIFMRTGLGIPLGKIIRTHVPKDLIKEAVKFGMPVWWSGQLFSLRNQMSSLWTVKLGKAELAAVEGMRTMWQFALKPLEYLGQATLPGLVAAKEERSKLFQEVLRVCLASFTFIGIAVAAGIPLFYQLVDWVRALLGKEGESFLEKYGEVPGLLRMLALLMPLVAFQTVANQLAVAGSRPRTVLIANLVTVAAVLAVVWPLSDRYGVFGVIGAGQIGEVASALTYALVLRADFPKEMKSGLRWTGWTFVAAAVALAPVHYFADWKWSWVISFPSVLIFTLLLFVFRVLEVEDLRRVARSFRKS